MAGGSELGTEWAVVECGGVGVWGVCVCVEQLRVQCPAYGSARLGSRGRDRERPRPTLTSTSSVSVSSVRLSWCLSQNPKIQPPKIHTHTHGHTDRQAERGTHTSCKGGDKERRIFYRQLKAFMKLAWLVGRQRREGAAQAGGVAERA